MTAHCGCKKCSGGLVTHGAEVVCEDCGATHGKQSALPRIVVTMAVLAVVIWLSLSV